MYFMNFLVFLYVFFQQQQLSVNFQSHMHLKKIALK